MGAGRGVLQGVGCNKDAVGVLQMSWGCCRRDGSDGGCGCDPKVFWGLGAVGAGTVWGRCRHAGRGHWGCRC